MRAGRLIVLAGPQVHSPLSQDPALAARVDGEMPVAVFGRHMPGSSRAPGRCSWKLAHNSDEVKHCSACRHQQDHPRRLHRTRTASVAISVRPPRRPKLKGCSLLANKAASIRMNLPLGAGSQLDSLSAPGDSSWMIETLTKGNFGGYLVPQHNQEQKVRAYFLSEILQSRLGTCRSALSCAYALPNPTSMTIRSPRTSHWLVMRFTGPITWLVALSAGSPPNQVSAVTLEASVSALVGRYLVPGRFRA